MPPHFERDIKMIGSMVVKYKHIGVATTRTTYEDGTIEIQYHNTVVAKRTPTGDVVLNSGGWRTPTTKKRINAALFEWACGWRVYQTNFQWYLHNWKENHEVTFTENLVIRDTGTSWVITSHASRMQSSFPKGS